ncbi:MAG: hypothetical protein HY927_06570 [Elusimicrobia bacterium]|nr:hypothetical protein [Elusimicrobiota bacterium]
MNTTSFRLLMPVLAVMVPSAWGQSPAAAKILDIDSRTTLRFSQITGPGRDASFYKCGTFITSEPAMYLRKDLPRGWKAGGEFRPRLTNDRLTDLRGLSVETLSMEVKNSSHVFSMGDYFAVLSQYSMSQLLKGFAYQRNFRDEENYVRAAFGTFDGMWDYVYKEDPNEPIDRNGGGVRGQLSREKYRLGLNWGVVHDDRTDPVRRRTNESAYYQNVGAFDWEWRPGAVTLDGEHAVMSTSLAPYEGERRKNEGHAERVRAQTTVLGARLMASFENVAPGFQPLAGSATPDRRRYNLQLSRRLSPVWQAFAKFGLSHDSIENSSARTRTTNTNYDLGVTRTRLFGRKESESSLAWHRTLTDTHNYSRDRSVDRLQFTLADQLTRTLRGRFLFEPTIDKEHVSGADALNYLYEVRVSDRRRLPKSWTLNSALSGRRRETENPATMGYDFQHGANARVDLARPGGFQTGVEFDLTGMDPFAGTQSRITRLRAFIEFKPKLPGDATTTLEYSNADYWFSDAARDYTEQHFKISLNWRI